MPCFAACLMKSSVLGSSGSLKVTFMWLRCAWSAISDVACVLTFMPSMTVTAHAGCGLG